MIRGPAKVRSKETDGLLNMIAQLCVRLCVRASILGPGLRSEVRRGRAERRLQRDSKAEFGGTTAWATRVSAPAAQFRWRKVMLARCGDLPIFR